MVRLCIASVAIDSLIFLACSARLAGQSAADDMLWLSPHYSPEIRSHPAETLSADAHNAAAEFKLARRAEEQRDYARAIEHYRGAVSAGRQVNHCLSLANLYLKLGELRVAEATTRECVKLDAASIYPALSLALILQVQGRFTQASEQLGTLFPLHPNNSFALYLSGRNYQGLNMTDRAEAELLASLKQPPELAEAHFRLGLIYSQKQKTYKQAELRFERALALGYPKAPAMKELGAVELKMGKWESCVRQLKGAIREDASFAEAYYQLSRAYLQSGKPAQAEQALRRYEELQAKTASLNREMSRAHAVYQRGVQLLRERDFASAESAFQAALGQHGINDLCYYGLAETLLLRGRFEPADDAIRKAIRLRPHEAAYYYLLAKVLQQLRRIPDAIAAAEHAIALNPEHAEAHDFAGKLYLAAGAGDRAVAAHRIAIGLDGGNPYLHLNLSDALRSLNHFEESVSEKDTYLRLLSAAQKRP
jgi:tetratricopeptide (TPR) repeat protein